MPLDAMLLSSVVHELTEQLIGAKIDKIYQPTKAEVVLLVRTKAENLKLLISANANNPRVHITKTTFENPASPPMFCMLMRKHFSGSRITEIRQPRMERVVDITVRTTNDLGDEVSKHIIVEIMGRNSNLVITDEDNRIIDCIRRVDYEMSAQRQVLPGLYYELPPGQDKMDPTELTLTEIANLVLTLDYPCKPDAFMLNHFLGLSPLVCRELSYRYSPDLENLLDLNRAERYAFAAYLKQCFSEFGTVRNTPYLLLKDGVPWDFTYMPIMQYGNLVTSMEQDCYSIMLDSYYAKRDATARLKSSSQAVTKNVTNLRNRTARKIQNQLKELAATENRDALRIQGELITANIYRVNRGDTRLVAENYYDPELASVEIALDPTLSPQQNAAKYFKEYNKAKNAEKYLTEQIEKAKAELAYLESVLDELERCESERDIADIKAELAAGGYVRSQDRKKQMKVKASKPMEFVSSEGLEIRVGKNNAQNDVLTTKSAFKSDVWLHAQKIHGSHVVISCNGSDPDEKSLLEAAMLAAWYSHDRNGQNIPVDYTKVKYVKKPAGAKPGMVIYETYQTLYVTPDETIIASLRKS